MGKKSTPTPPDFESAAEQSAASDWRSTREQAYANRPEQNTPWGSTSWGVTEGDQGTYNDATGRYEGYTPDVWTQETTLEPRLQGALDSQIDLQRSRSDLAQGMTGRMEDEYANPMDWSGFSERGGVPESRYTDPDSLQKNLDYSGLDELQKGDRYRQDSIDAAYGQATSRLDPRFEQEQGALESKLMAQGLRQGDAAYDTAMANFGRDKNDAYTSAQNAATIQGADDATRMYGMDSQRRAQQTGELGTQAAFANQAVGDTARLNAQNFGQDMGRSNYQTQLRQQEIAEGLQQRGTTLNEINAIMSGQQVGMPSMPQFNQAGKAAATDYSGAANSQWGADMDEFNARQAQDQMMMSGITDLGGAAMGFSDRRLKRNISRLSGLWHLFQYIWSDRWYIGVMADEAPAHAVHTHPSGYKMVDYGAL